MALMEGRHGVLLLEKTPCAPAGGAAGRASALHRGEVCEARASPRLSAESIYPYNREKLTFPEEIVDRSWREAPGGFWGLFVRIYLFWGPAQWLKG